MRTQHDKHAKLACIFGRKGELCESVNNRIERRLPDGRQGNNPDLLNIKVFRVSVLMAGMGVVRSDFWCVIYRMECIKKVKMVQE